MSFFRRRGICATCRAHYELDTEEKRFPNTCETHRKLLRDEYQRRERVMQWVKYNFDLVAEYMDKALELQEEESRKQRAAYSGMLARGQGAAQQNALSGLGSSYNQQYGGPSYRKY